MRHCRVAVAARTLCGQECSIALPAKAAPMCEAHRQMMYQRAEAEMRGEVPMFCEFYHWAHAGLLRAREAVS